MTKKTLRSELRVRRRAVTRRERRAAARRLAANLASLPMLHTARHIACYLSVDGEIDTVPILALISRRRKRAYLPLLRGTRLAFAPAHARLALNRYRILEPRAPGREHRGAAGIDLVLLPMVGFDTSGHRLGMGGGYYDRSLAFLARRTHWRRPRLIGLAYDFQQLATLPRDEWDVALDTIVTDRTVYHCGSAKR